jgi:hypothetical protein
MFQQIPAVTLLSATPVAFKDRCGPSTAEQLVDACKSLIIFGKLFYFAKDVDYFILFQSICVQHCWA